MTTVTITLNLRQEDGLLDLEDRIREALEDMGSEYTSIAFEAGPDDD